MTMYRHPVVTSKVIAVLRRCISSNPSFARSSIDCLAFSVFIVGGHLALWFELCHVLPHYHPTLEATPAVICHYVVGILTYLNTYISLYYTINTVASADFLEVCAKRRDSWHFCGACQSHVPPRCHHCVVCSVCILKRDHHCWFAGCCVGHGNYRYYLSMVVAVWVGAVYANIFHYSFVMEQQGGLSLGTIFCILLPHVAGLTGYLTLYQFFVALMSFIALLCLGLFSWLLVLQLMQLSHGQTEYEYAKGLYDYDRGFKQNLRDTLGERWYLALLSPWIPSNLTSDGMTFPLADKEE